MSEDINLDQQKMILKEREKNTNAQIIPSVKLQSVAFIFSIEC